MSHDRLPESLIVKDPCSYLPMLYQWVFVVSPYNSTEFCVVVTPEQYSNLAQWYGYPV